MISTNNKNGLIGWFLRTLAPTRFGVWWILNVWTYIDPPLLRMTNGRFSITGLSGYPICLLTTIGAKSGVEHTIPLISCPDGENLILIASYGGSERNPGWYYNLKANPEAGILSLRYTGIYIAREVTDNPEREELWNKALEIYKGFNNYATHTDRKIPVMLLEPKAARDETDMP